MYICTVSPWLVLRNIIEIFRDHHLLPRYACCFCVPVFLTVPELFNSQDWDSLDFLHDIEHEKHYSILRLMNFVQCAKIITFV